MGEFTQNLLKLTDFPFAYSLMGLLGLVFGQDSNPEELSFANFGPVLILTGFVATTLSICDPLGALQRVILMVKGGNIYWLKNGHDLLSKGIWGKIISPYIFPFPYIFAIAYSPQALKKRTGHKIDWDIVQWGFLESREDTSKKSLTFQRDGWKRSQAVEKELDKMGDDIGDMGELLEGLQEQSLKTKWITAEVDRITALIYFMIIISFFLSATLLNPNILTKFAQSFGYVQPSNLGILAYAQPINIGIWTFSIIALIAVIIMLKVRYEGLKSKALTVFKYLSSLGAIKTSKENFKSTLEDIERYLNDNHWPLAEYWVNRLQVDYSEFFLQEVKKK